MGRRGPKPKPKALKDVEGTFRADRHAPDMPEPEAGIPELPDGWGEESPWGERAVAEYFHMAPRLKKLGLLAAVDRPSLLLYCDAFGRWLHYREKVMEGSDTQETPNGYRANSPETNLMNRAWKDVKQALALFGLSPADRTRVSTMPSGDAADPAEEFFSGPKLADQ